MNVINSLREQDASSNVVSVSMGVQDCIDIFWFPHQKIQRSGEDIFMPLFVGID